MKIIADNINIFTHGVYEAIIKKDGGFIRKLAQNLVKNGADGLEINLGGWRASETVMPWLVGEIKKVCDCPLFVSPVPSSLKEVAEAHSSNGLFINCVTADQAMVESMLNAANCLNTGIVVLLTRKGFRPSTLDDLLLLAEDVIEKAEKVGLPPEMLILDPVLRPRLSMDSSGDMVNRPDLSFFAEAVILLGMLREPKIRTAAAMSNFMAGMSELVRKSFEVAAVGLLETAGLDYVIMDCSNRELIRAIRHSSKETQPLVSRKSLLPMLQQLL